MADPIYAVRQAGLFAVYPSPPVSSVGGEVAEHMFESSESDYSAPPDVPYILQHPRYPTLPADPADEGDQSSESSDESYSTQELQMGLDYYCQSDHATSVYPHNPDGTWCFSPAVLDQMELLNRRNLNEIEVEKEMETLRQLIDADFNLNSPVESAINLAESIENGVFNPWDDSPAKWTSAERVMLWKAKNPDMLHLGVPEIGEVQEDSTICACRFDNDLSEDEDPCFGVTCPIIKEGSSANQVGRAYELSGLRTKCERMSRLVKLRDGEDEVEELLDVEDDDDDVQEQGWVEVPTREEVEEEIEEEEARFEELFINAAHVRWHDYLEEGMEEDEN